MRVIAGIHRGRKLLAPPGCATRPMLARVREAIFNRLRPWTEGARVLDLFAGSGSLGIEALSRGAAWVRFVERAELARRALDANLGACDFEEVSEVVLGDALAGRSHEPGPWDIVFFDPPYPLFDAAAERDELLRVAVGLVRGQLADDGVFVFHAPAGRLVERDFPPDLEVARSAYGTTDIWFLGRQETA